MNLIEKLDNVLGKIGDLTVWSDLRTQCHDIEKEELRTILRKLWKDGYIDMLDGVHLRKYGDERGYSDLFNIQKNFEGKLFEEEGGYKGKRDREATENKRLRNLENTHTDIGSRLNRLTGWVAGGTIALVVVEIAKFIYEQLHSSCH